MKNLIYILAAILLSITSCKKDDKEYLITGQIIKDCSGEPLANFNIEGWLDCADPFSKCTEVFAATTDANGNFSMVITRKGGLEISTPGKGFPFLSHIPVSSSVSLGSFMAEPTTSFVYRIKVNNPYNVGDTLVTNLQGGGGAQFKFAAPLTDTSFTISNYSGKYGNSYENIGFILVEIGYGIYKNSINVGSNWYVNIPKVEFKIQSCHKGNQEVVLEIN